jgi:TRAP-type C4-dicarboxylate transport system permease small subunit
MISTLNKIIGRLLYWMIAVVHGLIVVVLFSGVVMRYLFNAPLFWSEEICLLGLLWLTFLGGAVLVRQDKNVSITIFTDMLPASVTRPLIQIDHMLILICFGVMIWQGRNLVERLSYSTTPALRMSEFWFAAAPLVGFIIMLYYQVQRFIADLRGLPAFPEELILRGEVSREGEERNP